MILDVKVIPMIIPMHIESDNTKLTIKLSRSRVK